MKPNGALQNIDVRFSYDINGLLEVDVNLPDSGESLSKVIDHSPIGLSSEQQQRSRERLAAVKIHPRDTLVNRNLLARLEKSWAQSLGDTRGQIGLWLEEFEMALASQQESHIAPLRQRLEGLLQDMTL